MSEQTQQGKAYRGNCHCGAIKYRVKLPPHEFAFNCNCSFCFRRNSRWVFGIKRADLVFVSGEEKLQDYQFGPKTAFHKSCPTCGVTVFSIRATDPDSANLRLNIRTIDGLDLDALEVKDIDGKAHGDAHVTPEFSDHGLQASEGMKIYTGSCHCGKVKIAFESEPLPKVEVLECNCSICTMHGLILTYPRTSSFRVSAEPGATLDYRCGDKMLRNHICSTCGLYAFWEGLLIPDRVAERMSEEEKAKKLEELKSCRGVNVRLIDGVEWGDVTLTKDDGRSRPPKYDAGWTD